MNQHTPPPPTSSKRARRRAWRGIAAVLATALTLGGLALGTAAPAQAALGDGAQEEGKYGPIGNYLDSSGTYVYCLDANSDFQAGAGLDGAVEVGSLPARTDQTKPHRDVSGRQIGEMSYIASVWGQTADPGQAIAVETALRSYVLAGDMPAALDFLTASQVAAYGPLAASFVAQAQAAPIGATGTAAGSLMFHISDASTYEGAVDVVDVPAGAAGTITLTNGVFSDTGSSALTMTSTGAPVSLAIIGTPPDDSGAQYSISATSSWTMAGGYRESLMLLDGSPNDQRLVWGTGGTAPQTWTINASDPQTRSTVFNPVVSTQVSSQYVAKGQPLSDQITFSTAADADGLNNPWYTLLNGSRVPVTGTGTVYGPLVTPPTQQVTVPADAPIAGHATVTSDTADPTTMVTATSDTPAAEPGYYTWVWDIDYASQPAVTKPHISGPQADPAGPEYAWTSGYGIEIETSIVPPDVSTTASGPTPLGFPIHDTAHVSGTVFEGAQLGFVLYQQPATVDAAGTPVATGQPVCTDDTAVYTAPAVPVTAAGDIDSAPYTPTDAGVYFWQETLYDAAGTVVTTGDCGANGETSVVPQIVVTTQASAQTAVVGATLWDIAIITGTVPDAATISWSLYRQARDTSSDVDEAVFSTQPVGLTPGVVDGLRVPSATYTVDAPGTYYWVETVHDRDGGVLAVDARGTASETTIVAALAPATPTGQKDIGGENRLAATGSDLLGGGLAVSVLLIVAVSFAAAARNRRTGEVVRL